jgi:NAD-dependent DNA ligase
MGIFSGQTFCVSGKFQVSQGEITSLLELNGGKIAGTPNKQCTFVVSDSIGSAKTQKAVKDGIDIVTEDWVNDSIALGKMLTDSKYFLSGGGNGSASAADASEEDEEEEEEEEKPKKKAAPKKAAAAAPKAKAGGAVFEDLTFCVSGSFSLSQGELKELIIKNGGHVAATPNRTCAYLISDSIGSSKTQKAIKDGLAIATG